MIRQSDVGKEKEAGRSESTRVKWQLDVSRERKHAPGGQPARGTAPEKEKAREREKRLSSLFHANITGWLRPRWFGHKQEVPANPGLP